jgi:hypothetical protein
MFRKLAFVVAICAGFPLGGAYASGPLYTDHHASEPTVGSEMGRIYLYRPSAFWGAPFSPAIKIDDVKVGVSEVGTYFYVDRPPGTYIISAKSEKLEPVTVHVAAGQTIYVRFRASPGFLGWHIIPANVDDTRGLSEIKECHYVGTDAPSAPAPATTPASAPAADAPAQTPPKN